ncbi:valine--pyruvate transaminase [Desulforhopalus singaporensis]|uniref:Valine-pyruvate aminotransferase apoenzyme n=1 Tax=Desulforhopalus singaporensis TaxID=91360 RepID=A0A1H0MSF5_9BACT|nr:valine--pyruvate transaminase [Desulforhopalus singaporensis]SDO83070.1 valine-pyruvate aminotransferase apoenzyme [Desulforhopalus singaporensis]
MEFSTFGRKLTCDAGILSLMEDLGRAKEKYGDDLVMMGGGNPGQIAEFQELMRGHLSEICSDPAEFGELVGSYSPPYGNREFVTSLSSLFTGEFGWNVGPDNICLTNGSQTGFFMLFNLLAGKMSDGSVKKICLPMAPEYIGYADLGLEQDLFVSNRPNIEIIDDWFFKYRVDFENLHIDHTIGAICISRPTNPTGNVIDDNEMQKLMARAERCNIPIIIDSAYGAPFPGMIYTEATPVWNENLILSLSLSKLGLPAVRTGIVIASKEIIAALTAMNAIMSLSPTNFGAHLANRLVADGTIIEVSKSVMQPFYRSKMKKAVAAVKENFGDLPCRMHVPEGAMFLWLWFEGLPITSLELYQRLKEEGALVVSGHYFFPGLVEEWPHKDQCLRVTYSQDDGDVQKGLRIIAETVRRVYAEEKKDD